ncbi:two-component system vancomycin resistance associated response regulator VraR [Anaerosolibacter carboniphilus]|uniref:Stage 0 sporulation protein A homolog n=1 Tax=Anaerosolibacter carboniphilus TaxID=1417629 RepID=A0A841L4F8_9FIRM|nr:response regulator transcription factor [Anaerosolibacter carboniphilus]MBB6217279.1 two-component system vancomycin resistance associated response regulator VraR [Anaerosolibacter carboniphilus]
MADTNTKIKVLVVDDMESFRVRFKNALSSDKNIELIGLAKNGYEAIVLTALQKPHVIIMDVRMENDISGIEASKEIIKMLPDTKIIISSVIDDDEIIFKAYQTGVADYIIKKNAKTKDVLDAVYAAYNNQSPIRPEIAERLRKEFQKMRNYKDSVLMTLCILSKLTPVEVDILILLSEGYSREQISQTRHIAFSTTKTHINNILGKFNKESSKELIQMLTETNIIEMIKQTKSGQVSL